MANEVAGLFKSQYLMKEVWNICMQINIKVLHGSNSVKNCTVIRRHGVTEKRNLSPRVASK